MTINEKNSVTQELKIFDSIIIMGCFVFTILGWVLGGVALSEYYGWIDLGYTLSGLLFVLVDDCNHNGR